MLNTKRFKSLTLVIFLLFAVTIIGGCGQGNGGDGDETNFPEKSLTMIIPFDPGTASDQSGRMLASLAEKELGQKIVIVNKPGSAGAVGYSELANSKADGYTICSITSTLVVHKLLGNLEFDHNNVETVLTFQLDPCILAVNAESDYGDLNDFIDYAKANPGKVTHGTGAPGGIINVASLAMEDTTGIDFNIIPAGGGGAQPAVQLAGGHIDSAMTTFGDAGAQIDAENVRVLGIMAPERVGKFPDIPTFGEMGYDVNLSLLRGVAAPKGTPQEVLEVLSEAFTKASETQEFQDFLLKQGAAYTYSSLDESKQLYDEQAEVFERVLK
ncbi:MAG TPA: tripartite tricarboxylate transporter substrate binding protein [Clostridia bacterium]|nr:tripartite tricarboxylate transporter substrate binding protein [Clostridia bacterium]